MAAIHVHLPAFFTMSEKIHDWLPGVLCNWQLKKLFELSVITGVAPAEYGKSSIDLTLSSAAWTMPLGSLKPAAQSYEHQKHKYPSFFVELKPDRKGQFVLAPKQTYLFKVQQRLNSTLISKFEIHGQATAKSSIGRLDVLARLIVDGMDCYEGFEHEKVGSGDMFIEITPLSFPIIVWEGAAVTQLRFFLGPPDQCEIRSRLLYRATLGDSEQDSYLRVDLSDARNGSTRCCAFKAKQGIQFDPIPANERVGTTKPSPKRYWDAKQASLQNDGDRFLEIEAGAFYILRSKEKLALHGTTAVYCMAIDETIGEMRIHYAGFVHPFFGRERSDGKDGTPLIFEVRGHDVPVILRDGEKLAKLRYYQMSSAPIVEMESKTNSKKSVRKTKKKVVSKGSKTDQYRDQSLNLSGLFAPWT